ncbi:MAG TPA: DUF1499 domain-containing protein [Gemmatimonadales bacterium]
MSGVPAPAAARALIQRGSGANFAATAAGDPRLLPRLLPLGVDQAADRVAGVIGRLARWRLTGREGRVLTATRTTRIFRFVDDVLVLLEPAPGGTRVLARSASRVGRSDLGQNRRNLAELWRALDAG